MYNRREIVIQNTFSTYQSQHCTLHQKILSWALTSNSRQHLTPPASSEAALLKVAWTTPLPELVPWKTREAHHTTSSPPKSFYPTLLDCPGRKCVDFVTKHLCSSTEGRREINLKERDGTNEKVLWFGFSFFFFLLFMDKENIFYAEEV